LKCLIGNTNKIKVFISSETAAGEFFVIKKRIKKIDCIMYYVPDLKEAAKFYEEVLGLNRVWTDTDAQMIGFLFPESDSEIVLHTNANLPNPDVNYQVEKVEEFCQYYRKQGYEIELEPIDVRCGKFAILKDPYGNRIPVIDLTNFDGVPRYDNIVPT
jgi:catechol 2,3-dioxygenase-like lactoylglutathione lyase family enzyme